MTFFKLLSANCKKAQEGTPLYRGLKSRPGATYLRNDPAEYTRVSEYTENWYILLLQLLPEWKKFPSLSKSIICTSRRSDAGDWGAIYRVYPFDGAILVVTPKEHMWASFRRYVNSMDDVNDIIRGILDSTGYNLIDENETNPKILKSFFDKIDKIEDRSFIDSTHMGYMKRNWELSAIATLERYRDGHIKTLLDVFSIIMEPKGFLLKKAGDELPIGKQVWTDSPCLLEMWEPDDPFDINDEV
jgi:hypothetical protein